MFNIQITTFNHSIFFTEETPSLTFPYYSQNITDCHLVSILDLRYITQTQHKLFYQSNFSYYKGLNLEFLQIVGISLFPRKKVWNPEGEISQVSTSYWR